MSNQENVALHPVAILKQAGSFCRSNLKQLGLIYLIFNLPVTLMSFLPFMNTAAGQPTTLAQTAAFMLILVISSWGYISLLLSANKIVSAQTYTIKQSIQEVKNYFLKYLVLIICIVIFAAGFAIIVGILGTVVLPMLLKLNQTIGLIFGVILLVAALLLVLAVALRWSLSALVCVYETLGPLAALKQSCALIKKHINPVVGTYGLIILVYLVGLLPVFILGIFTDAGPDLMSPVNIVTTLYIFLMNIILVPFWTMSNVVLYKKLKEIL
ncbi:MAG: hypothetical protein WC543_00420 [Candidatus Omnitrophota bacterium]